MATSRCAPSLARTSTVHGQLLRRTLAVSHTGAKQGQLERRIQGGGVGVQKPQSAAYSVCGFAGRLHGSCMASDTWPNVRSSSCRWR